MPQDPGALPRAIIEAVFAAIDSGDIDGATRFFCDDITVHFANVGPLIGSTAFVGLYSQFSGVLQGVRHEIHDVWCVVENRNVLVAKMTAHYTRVDGEQVSLPCCNIFRMSGELISDYQVFMDITPALSATTAATTA